MEKIENITNKILIVILFAIVAAITSNLISSYDFWWHLNLGRVVYETGLLKFTDTFTFTYQGEPQFNGEWLSELLFFLAYQLGGYGGVLSLKIAVLFGTIFFMYKALTVECLSDRQTRFWAALLVLLLLTFAIRFRLFVRPFIFSYLGVAIFLYALMHWQRFKKQSVLWLLLPVEVLWANLSKGAFYGPLLVMIYAGAEFAGAYVARYFPEFHRRLTVGAQGDVSSDDSPQGIDPVSLKQLGLAAVLLFIASLLNPETYIVYEKILTGLFSDSVLFVSVGEQQPLSFSMLFGYRFRYTFGFQFLFLLAALSLYFVRERKNLFYLILLILFFIPVLSAIRMIGFFSLVAAVPTVRLVELAIIRIQEKFNPKRQLLNGAMVAFLLVPLGLVALFDGDTYKIGADVRPDRFPSGAMDFVEKHQIRGNAFNSYPFGGYIAWRNPGVKVFIDGRVNQLYGPMFFNVYNKILHDENAWKRAESKWKFDFAIFEYDFLSGGYHFPKYITENPEWALVYWDDISVVYVRRIPRFEKLIAQFEYKMFKPNLNNFEYLTSNRSLTHIDMFEVMDREINHNPRLQEVRLARAFLLYYYESNVFQEAIIQELQICLSLKPDLAIEHSALANLLFRKGLEDEARQHLKRAVELDPSDKIAQELLKEHPL